MFNGKFIKTIINSRFYELKQINKLLPYKTGFKTFPYV